MKSVFVKKYFFQVVFALLLVGCLQTRQDIRENEGRKSTQDSVSTMQKAAAENTSRFSEVEAANRELNGRVEVLENKMSQFDQGALRSQKSTEEQLAETNKKVFLLQEELAKMEMQIGSLSEQVAQSAKAKDEKSIEEKLSVKAEKKSSFDVAEEFFQKKEWKKAILNYQKYRDTTPKGKKVPESTYKIGVCFQEIGMKDEARSFYEELVSKYPKSDEARRAKIRLKKLK